MSIIDELRDHFERQFSTLKGVFSKTNDEAWSNDDQRLKGVRQWLYHVLETIEFYFGGKTASDFEWSSRFGGDWEDAESISRITRSQMEQYIVEVERTVKKAIEGFDDDILLAPESTHTWTGKSVLGKMIYLIRHNQQHIGDINRVLRVCGCEPLDWH